MAAGQLEQTIANIDAVQDQLLAGYNAGYLAKRDLIDMLVRSDQLYSRIQRCMGSVENDLMRMSEAAKGRI